MFQRFTNKTDYDLSGEASKSTWAGAAQFIGLVFLLLLIIMTGIHAVSLSASVQTAAPALDEAGQPLPTAQVSGDVLHMIRIAGVVLVEAFAAITGLMFLTHSLRAKQKPIALTLEVCWFLFAAANLIASFATERGSDIPAFVHGWTTYGLPVSALVIGSIFYLILRLNPDAKRRDDQAELAEKFREIDHNAELEVMLSEQMQVVLRQMKWQTLPRVLGRQLNLTEQQIEALMRQAPQLLDLNSDGVPDIQQLPAGRGQTEPALPPTTSPTPQPDIAQLITDFLRNIPIIGNHIGQPAVNGQPGGNGANHPT